MSKFTIFARRLCNKQLVKHFLWFKIGSESSSRLREMDCGSALLNTLDRTYDHIYHQQRHIINKLGIKINNLGSDISAFRWICETVLCECKTEKQLVIFAVMFLVVIVRMLEQTDQSDLKEKADHISSILCEIMSHNMNLRDREKLYRRVAFSFFTFCVCLTIHSMWTIGM